MTDRFRPGDRVEWNTPQGKTRGKVKRKLTSETHVKGHKVAASRENPQYLVESARSGATAAHKPDALTKPKMSEVQRRTLDEFRATVNMPPAQLERWLRTAEARAVGQKDSAIAESVGHASGRRIVELLRTRQADYTDADFDHMRKVIGYVHRHTAQRPPGDIEHTPWRYSLMNWGHDPLK